MLRIPLLLCALAACAAGSQPESFGKGDASILTTDCNGKPDGTPCGDASEYECDLSDMCFAGVCIENFAPTGSPCGDAADGRCSDADSCDGQGACSANDHGGGSPCGDPSVTECDGADVCDDSGQCAQNLAAEGTACGDVTISDCSAADSCDGNGSCHPRNSANGGGCSDCSDGPSECVSCASGVCQNQCGQPVGLATTFDTDNGLHGNMFDVVARTSLKITGFDVNLPVQSASAPAHNVLIYYRMGTHVGHELAAGDWTLLGGTSVDSNGAGVATPIPTAFEVNLAPGERAAFYVTTMGTTMRYSYGSHVGAMYASDPNIEVYEGSGNAADFGSYFTPRVFNGAVHYRLCD